MFSSIRCESWIFNQYSSYLYDIKRRSEDKKFIKYFKFTTLKSKVGVLNGAKNKKSL
jgi:hypothetical protein